MRTALLAGFFVALLSPALRAGDGGSCFDPKLSAGRGFDDYRNACIVSTGGCFACSPTALPECSDCAENGKGCAECAAALKGFCGNICCTAQAEVCGDGIDQDCDGADPAATPANLAAGRCAGGLDVAQDFVFPAPETYRFDPVRELRDATIRIVAGGVTLDCRGATIWNSRPFGGIAGVEGGGEGVVVRGCGLVNGGIDLHNCEGCRVLENRVKGRPLRFAGSGTVAGNLVVNSVFGLVVSGPISAIPTAIELRGNTSVGNTIDVACTVPGRAPVVFGGGNTADIVDPSCRGPLPGLAALFSPAPDCDGNGAADSAEIAMGAVEDCNRNGVPDACETGVSCGPAGDLNRDGALDETDLAMLADCAFDSGEGLDCGSADLDGSGAADLQDYLLFKEVLRIR